jgi:hypothetical protein
MIKRINSLLIAVTIILGGLFVTSAQEEEKKEYNMWESIMLTPVNSQLKTLQENMRKHNQTYHNEGAYDAQVFNVVTGPNSGNIIWEMGPLMFSHLDGRPSEGGHDEDWRDNVMPYIKKMHSIEYWRDMEKLSNTDGWDGDNSKRPIMYIRYFEVEKGHGYTIQNLLKRMSDAVKEMGGDVPWGLYSNEFRQGDIGRHISWVAFYENWTEFDNDDASFKEAYLKVHGENSWDSYIRGMDDTFSNSWDEIWVYNKNMSGK